VCVGCYRGSQGIETEGQDVVCLTLILNQGQCVVFTVCLALPAVFN